MDKYWWKLNLRQPFRFKLFGEDTGNQFIFLIQSRVRSKYLYDLNKKKLARNFNYFDEMKKSLQT